MSVSSAGSTSATNTGSIDVAGIVQQLMTVENRPLDQIKSKIADRNLVISDLGTIKSKVSAFQDALKAFEDPTTFSGTSAASSDASIVQATSSDGAALGNHSIEVSSLAKATSIAITGFLSGDIAVSGSIDPANLSLTLGDVTYTYSSSGMTSNPTLNDLANWVNGLGVNIIARVNNTNTNSQWGLFIDGTLSGDDNDVTYTGLTPSHSTPAVNSFFILDGQEYSNSSNTLTINGLSLNLLNAAPGNPKSISVIKGQDVSSPVINALIVAYNDLISSYKKMTANSSNSSTPGTFANSPTTLAFINQIKASFAQGFSYTSGGQLKQMSLSSIGIDLQIDGTAKFNSTAFLKSKDLLKTISTQDILALGVTTGYLDATHSLNSYLTAQAKTGGMLDEQIQSQAEAITQLSKRQDDLQTRLNAVQNNLISQYSALNALLFQLNNTSTALTSALTALTNSQSKN